jgi:hypothetical protein
MQPKLRQRYVNAIAVIVFMNPLLLDYGAERLVLNGEEKYKQRFGEGGIRHHAG